MGYKDELIWSFLNYAEPIFSQDLGNAPYKNNCDSHFLAHMHNTYTDI